MMIKGDMRARGDSRRPVRTDLFKPVRCVTNTTFPCVGIAVQVGVQSFGVHFRTRLSWTANDLGLNC